MAKSTQSKSTAKKSTKSQKPTADPRPTTQAEMKTSEIRDLIDFISKTGLNEVNIETSELKLHVKREPDQKILKSAAPVVAAAPTQPQTVLSQPVQAAQPQQETAVEAAPSGKKTVDIKSPMIGTFYKSPNPDSPPFVSVGDKVSKGQTVCIIEAMKLFNEIESEVSGTVVKIMVDNSTPVEYDQVLYVVEPD